MLALWRFLLWKADGDMWGKRRHTDTCSRCGDTNSEASSFHEPSCNNLAAVHKHTAHTQTDDKSLSQPYRPVPSFTSASLTAANAEHEHAKRGEDTASGT